MSKIFYDILLMLANFWRLSFVPHFGEYKITSGPDIDGLIGVVLGSLFIGLGVVFIYRVGGLLQRKFSNHLFTKTESVIFFISATIFYSLLAITFIVGDVLHLDKQPASQVVITPVLLYSFLLMGLFYLFGWSSVPYWIITSIYKIIKKKSNRKIEYLSFSIVVVTLVLMITSVLFFFEENPNGGAYNQLNAAIKNTCLTDPRHDHCPHTLEELSYVEPEMFAETNKTAQMIYSYYPERNEYTLIVRYKPDQAIIFDPRFLATTGLDFQEFSLSTWGKDRLIDPPKFDGPWDQIQEWNK
jgi:hypothetical protein